MTLVLAVAPLASSLLVAAWGGPSGPPPTTAAPAVDIPAQGGLVAVVITTPSKQKVKKTSTVPFSCGE